MRMNMNMFQDVKFESHDEKMIPLGTFTIITYYIGQTPWYILKMSELPDMFLNTASIPCLTKKDLKNVRNAIDKALKE